MSNLSRWDPFREMMSLRSMMDRMFDNSFINAPSSWFQSGNWDLALDVAETDDKFMVKASLPGINPDDLEVTYNANVLTIKGEVKEEEEKEDKRYHLRERRYGAFSRSISLPSSVNAEKIKASYESGVLTLELPKAEEAKAKRIQIQSGAGRKVIEGKVHDIKAKN